MKRVIGDMMKAPPADRPKRWGFPRVFGEYGAPAMLPDLQGVLASYRPQLLVHDSSELAGPIAATAAGIPYVNHSFGHLLAGEGSALAAAKAAPPGKQVRPEPPRPRGGECSATSISTSVPLASSSPTSRACAHAAGAAARPLRRRSGASSCLRVVRRDAGGAHARSTSPWARSSTRPSPSFAPSSKACATTRSTSSSPSARPGTPPPSARSLPMSTSSATCRRRSCSRAATPSSATAAPGPCSARCPPGCRFSRSRRAPTSSATPSAAGPPASARPCGHTSSPPKPSGGTCARAAPGAGHPGESAGRLRKEIEAMPGPGDVVGVLEHLVA